MPVWLSIDDRTGGLRIVEERGAACAIIPAWGEWPPFGATVDLFLLRRAATNCEGRTIELIAIDEGILVPTTQGYTRLNLLAFGPASKRAQKDKSDQSTGHSSLPLFSWAATLRPIVCN